MTDHTELKRLAENHLSLGQAYTVAKPSVLLALIAENERFNAENKQLILLEVHGGTAQAAINLLAERDQLKAENELLASSRAKLAGELSRLRAKHKDWSADAAMGKGEQS